MNFMRQATDKAMNDIQDQKKNFEMENKVRTIVAEMLISMNDKLTEQTRALRTCQAEITSTNTKMDATNYKLDREAKIKDMVDSLKVQLSTLEKGMALDIENAVKNHDQTSFEMRRINDLCSDLAKERSTFMQSQDKIRSQVKDYEHYLSEVRGLADRDFCNLKQDLTKRIDIACSEFDELKTDRRQLKAMVKNQNFQFTELQKAIGVLQNRANQTDQVTALVPGLIKYTEDTDNYLQNYLPTDVYSEVHRCMQATLISAPTKMRLDQIEYSHRRMMEALDKIKQIGTLTQETFVKNEFSPLKLDFDAYSIRTQYEDEEKAKLESQRREAQLALTRKTSSELFHDNMFSNQNLIKMTAHMERRMNKSQRKLWKTEFDNNAWIRKLIDFYEDEMGSEDIDSTEEENSDGSSDSGSSSSGQSSASKQSLSSIKSVADLMTIDDKKLNSNTLKTNKIDEDSNSAGSSCSSSQRSKSEVKSSDKSDSSIDVGRKGSKSSKQKPKNKISSGQVSEQRNKYNNSSSHSQSKRSKNNKSKGSFDKEKPVDKQRHNASVTDSIHKSVQGSITSSQRSQSSNKDTNNIKLKKMKSSKKAKGSKILEVDENLFIEEDQINMASSVGMEKRSKKSKKDKKDKKSKSKKKNKAASLAGTDEQSSVYRDNASSLLLASSGQSKLSKESKKKKLKGKRGMSQAMQEELLNTQRKISQVLNAQSAQAKELEELKDLQAKKAFLEGTLESAENQATDDEFEQILKHDDEDTEDNEKSNDKGKKSSSRKQLKEDASRKDKSAKKIKGERKPKKEKGDGQPRTGAKANKEALAAIQKRLEECLTKDEFEKQSSNVTRAIASVTVFKTQMKIFEKKFLSDKQHELRLENNDDIVQKCEDIFTNKKVHLSSEASRMNLSLAAAAKMKQNLTHNINRVDLLTDAKIGDIKGLLTELASQIILLSKRVTIAENDMLKKEYETIPVDVMALSKTEYELRQDLALMLSQATEQRDLLQKEFKRLRREHYGNLKDIEQVLLSFDQIKGKVQKVTDTQGLNDQAMASIFKIMKLDFALCSQDEIDRQSMNLMGLTNTAQAQGQKLDHTLNMLQQNNEQLVQQVTDRVSSPFSSTASASRNNNGGKELIQADVVSNSAAPNLYKTGQRITSSSTTGKFIKKLRPSTKLPIEHKMQNDGLEPNQARKTKIVSLDNNCQSCAPGNYNEITMKAFKMACLQYKPSPVTFEQATYKRQDLLVAKNSLLKYCLSQLKHLDLGVMDSASNQVHNQPAGLQNAWLNMAASQELEGKNYVSLDPIKLPIWPVDQHYDNKSKSIGGRQFTHNKHLNIDWLNQDSIESLKQASAGYIMAPNSSKRIEPARLSIPRRIENGGPATQRGRQGKLGDSQQYAHISSQPAKGPNLLHTKQHLRQAISVHKVERHGMQDHGFNPYPADSFAPTTDEEFGDESIIGRAVLQASPDNTRPVLFTQGSPLDQMPRQKQLIGQRLNIRTQGGEKPLYSIGQQNKVSEPSYNQNNAESTVYTSLQSGVQYTQTYANNVNGQKLSNVKRTNQSFDSQVVSTNNSGANTPKGSMSNRPTNIRLPSLQADSTEKIKIDMPNSSRNGSRKEGVDILKELYKQNAMEINSQDKQSQGSFLQQNYGRGTPLQAIDDGDKQQQHNDQGVGEL